MVDVTRGNSVGKSIRMGTYPMRNNEIRQRRLEELHEEAEIRRAAAVKEVDDIESLMIWVGGKMCVKL